MGKPFFLLLNIFLYERVNWIFMLIKKRIINIYFTPNESSSCTLAWDWQFRRRPEIIFLTH